MAVLLNGHRARPWSVPAGGRAAFTAEGYYLGQGARTPLEIAVARATSRPAEADVRALWKRRKGNQPSPLLLVVLWPSKDGDRASVCGSSGDDPPVYSDRDPGQLARLAALALAEPDHHNATRLLGTYLPEDGAGLRNVSLFASYYLAQRIPRRPDWGRLCEGGVRLLDLRRERLVEALGFSLDMKGPAAVLRSSAGQARALAVFLDDTENPDVGSSRFNGMTAVSWAIAYATAENIPYVMLTRGPQLRLYTTRFRGDTAGKGGTSAFIEITLPLLTAENAGYLPLLCSAESLADGGLFEVLFEESHSFAADVGSRLRSRVYDFAVPHIAQALITRHAATAGATDESSLSALYDRALLILFRLLFVAYAEDRDLLPLRSNGLYRQRSLKYLARELAGLANAQGWEKIPFDDHATDLWDGVQALWGAVDQGRRDWNVPRYNGGMFSADPDVNPQGAALAELRLSNSEIGPALLGLLIDQTDDGWGPIDFSSLDVREFGTIYEGLLESNLAVAPCDLTLGKNDTWIPARLGDEVKVEEGAVYLHNKSGARKASGSYFTKPFAVSHLLDHALEPAIDAHLNRLRDLLAEGDEVAAAERFFDFRCIDLAMGSGHFLVAAVDRIERRFSEFLAEHRVGGVLDELSRLAAAAAANLAEVGLISDGVDTNTLLRRQIAHRCIYGVDLNQTSVDLAKLALWIHTFVQGLPLTSLNHGLIIGNSLTGIGTLAEAVDVLDPDAKGGKLSFVHLAIHDALEAARSALARFAKTSEATAAEVREARLAHREAERAAGPARLLLDLAVAVRAGVVAIPSMTFDAESLLAEARRSGAAEAAAALSAVHFPAAFPEVFLRDRPGFDCIVGNPPWEKLQLEEHSFYALTFPGLRGLSQGEADQELAQIRRLRPDLVREYERETARTQAVKSALARGPYPGMNAGRPDLYKAFAWRFLQLVREDGSIGVVLPRKAVEASGMKKWRLAVLEQCELSDVTMLLNSRGWVFDDVHQQWTIGLLSIRKQPSGDRLVRVRGPFRDEQAYRAGMRTPAVVFRSDDLLSWSDSAMFPLLRSSAALEVFAKLRVYPPLAQPRPGWAPRGMRELNASDDKEHFVFERGPHGLWPVYKGESFDIWNPETGIVYAYAEPEHILAVLQARRLNQVRNRRSALFGKPQGWTDDLSTLSVRHPRIAWRDSSRATDSRTIRVALVPPDTVLVHQAYTLFWREGGPREEAYALGVMSSLPFDWYARQLVESHVTVEFVNGAPIPVPASDNPLRRLVEFTAGRLAAVDDRFAEWADQLGVHVASVAEGEKASLVAELDAAVGLLYGLSHEDMTTIFEGFHAGWDYSARLQAVLTHMTRLRVTGNDVASPVIDTQRVPSSSHSTGDWE